jgi:hypothetical protein
MSKPDSITIDEVKYIRADSITSNSPPLGDKRIIVADRGWVFAGACEDHEDGTVTIRNASNIRIWGTTKGLGELVNGPLSSTKYDAYGTVRCSPIVQINVIKGW